MALKGDFEILRSFDDTKIAYAAWGDGPALVFVNGIACSDAYWTFVVPYLAERGYKAVFFDYRGHGRSGMPGNPNEISAPSFARDLWAVADALDVDEAVLAGHSYGSQVMFEAYRFAPDRVRGLVSVAGPFETPLDGFTTVSAAKYILAMTQAFAPVPWATRAFWRFAGRETRALTLFGKATRMAGRSAPDEIMDEYFTKVSRIDPLFLIRAAREMQAHSARDVLPEVAAPVLILSGANDVMTPPRVQREMASLLPDARLEVWDDSGHTFPVDEIDRFNKRIKDFLDDAYSQESAPEMLGARTSAKDAPSKESDPLRASGAQSATRVAQSAGDPARGPRGESG